MGATRRSRMKMKVRGSEISAEQVAMMIAVCEEWLAHGLSARPADRPAAEAELAKAYRAVGAKPPNTILWLRSPLEGLIAANILYGCRVTSHVDHRMSSARGAVMAEIEDSIQKNVWFAIKKLAFEPVSSQVTDRVRDLVSQTMWAREWHEKAMPLVVDQLRQAGLPHDNSGHPIVGYISNFGQHDAQWLSYYDVAGRLGVDTSPLESTMAIAKSCGWWWPFDQCAILCERPTVLHRDDQGRLHNESGPALLYPDGFAIYAIHGVLVEARIIEQPETITAHEITTHDNAEYRRVLLDRFGIARYIESLGLKPDSVAHVRCWDAEHCNHTDEQHTARLYRATVMDDETITMLQVYNSTPEPDGSIKQYWIRVPPSMRSAYQAVAWTFGMTEREYQLQCQS